MRITDTHIYFWGGLFSNFKKCPFYMFALEFDNSEQAYMYLKAKFFKDEEIADLILKTPNPKEAKKLARTVKGYNDEEWSKVRFEKMIYVNKFKYQVIGDCRSALINSGDKILVEASPYDKIWGVGLAKEDDKILDEKNWLGQNLLGKALMEVRKLI